MKTFVKILCLTGILIICVMGLSCKEIDERNDAVTGMKVVDGRPIDIKESIQPEELLAYVAQDETKIFVAEGYEDEIAQMLGATVAGLKWKFQLQGQEVEYDQHPLNPEDYYPKVSYIIWTYMKGYQCMKKPKGTLLDIHNKSGKLIAKYKTTEEDWWCIRMKNKTCKIIWKEITGEFYIRKNGKWIKKTETRKLSACTP